MNIRTNPVLKENPREYYMRKLDSVFEEGTILFSECGYKNNEEIRGLWEKARKDMKSNMTRSSGVNPNSFVAAVIRRRSILEGKPLKLRSLSSFFDVTEVSIRNNIKNKVL